MKKFSLTLCTCVALSLFPTIAFAEKAQDERVPASITSPTKSKRQTAREVLAELGVGKQYDLFFWNSVDIANGTGTRAVFSSWLQKTLASVAGWKYVESRYVSRLEANFSEAELKELLDLAKRPLMKKLMRAEIQAYEETGEQRARLLFQAWDDFNSGKLGAPPNL